MNSKFIKLYLKILLVLLIFVFVCCKPSDNVNSENSLSGKWLLHSVNNVEIVKEKTGSGIPYLILNPNKLSLSGFTGCNDLDGKMSISDSKITFGEMSVSKMFCPEAEYEYELINFLFNSEPVSYKIENNSLFMSKSGKDEMIFKKEE